MTANASDRDGNIVSYEWWVNDVKQSSTSSSLWLSAWDTYPTIPQTSTKVKVTVSDNDGFSTSATKYVQYDGDSASGNRSC